jgi:putative transposase
LHDDRAKFTIDKSGANAAAVPGLAADNGQRIELRQSTYLENLIKQDHPAVKWQTRTMMAFKVFAWARKLIAGINTRPMPQKRQLGCHEGLVVPA